MKHSPELAAARKAGIWGSALTTLLGLLFLVAGSFDEKYAGGNLKPLHYLSYDTLCLVRPSIAITNLVIVSMDEDSHQQLGQPHDRPWDRSLHAKLLDTLFARGARTVVFDIVFPEAGPDPQADAQLADAMRRATGKVIHGATLRFEEQGDLGGSQLALQPIELFAAVAPWGVVDLPQDPDGALRRHPEWPQIHLAWRTAEVLGVEPPERDRPRWINYYGPREAIRHVSYYQALQAGALPPAVFSNQVVFVGWSRVLTPSGAKPGDEHRTPHTRWTGYLHTGVEIEATVLLNLLRRDWVEQLPWPVEAALFTACGVLFGFGLARLRPLPALGWAAAGVGLVGIGALGLFSAQRIWFPWLIVVGVQIPFALGWSVLCFVQRASQSKDIPDHTLLRCVGRGAYGEVWLARNAIGGFHAVKIVYRKKFPTAEPFEREFRGMTNFAPLSRSHPGLVQILHVGRNDLRGCFYYIMEAADDEMSGAKIHPDRYQPKTLAGEIARRGRLPVRECVQLALDLTSALGHLHRHKLIHRDLKPANIIYVSNQPKLADVGLVTTLGDDAGTTTRLGTSGYLAPEGPGAAAADVFALGKTLYEAATGNPCGQFPELPSNLNVGAEADALLRLHEILLTACETDPADRYASAAVMRADLLALQAAFDRLSKPA